MHLRRILLAVGVLGAVFVPAAAAWATAPSTTTTHKATTTTTLYANCTAAWDAGAAPLHAGEPGYSKVLDHDGDGTACENDPRASTTTSTTAPSTSPAVPRSVRVLPRYTG